ncbi:MAG: hypothetical protein ACO3HV_08195 [Candidatus Nanopelagicales bacterium]
MRSSQGAVMSSPAAPSWGTVLGRLDGGLDLDPDSARWAVEQIMSGLAAPDDVKAFLLGVQAKGATAAEVSGAAEAMRAAARRRPWLRARPRRGAPRRGRSTCPGSCSMSWARAETRRDR